MGDRGRGERVRRILLLREIECILLARRMTDRANRPSTQVSLVAVWLASTKVDKFVADAQRRDLGGLVDGDAEDDGSEG